MSVKKTAQRLYARIIDVAGERFIGHETPKEGWLTSFRKALDMSASQLAKRIGVTRAAIYQTERKELAGEITLKQLEKYASALGGRVVYAIVPDGGMTLQKGGQLDPVTVDDLIRQQAMAKASAVVAATDTHMALEQQGLGSAANNSEIIRLAYQLQQNPPRDFWELT